METIDELTVYNNAVKALVDHINSFRVIHTIYAGNGVIDIMEPSFIRKLALVEKEFSNFCYDRMPDYV
jgi:hypothetical protein